MDKSKIAIEIFDKRANEYHAKFMDVNLYSDSFDLFCNNIVNKNAEVLELACGPGNITKYLLNKRPGFKITGIDLAPKMLEIARLNNPTAEFQLMDCKHIGQIEKKYDAIMCGFCLPYLSKEETLKLISDCFKLLKNTGILYLSTMEDDHHKSGIVTSSYGDKMYMYYHEADYLTDFLKKNHFEMLDLSRKKYPANDGTVITDLLIIARKEMRFGYL